VRGVWFGSPSHFGSPDQSLIAIPGRRPHEEVERQDQSLGNLVSFFAVALLAEELQVCRYRATARASRIDMVHREILRGTACETHVAVEFPDLFPQID